MTRGVDCSRDRVRDIVKLEVQPDFRAGGQHIADDFRAFSRVQLQSDFEKRNLLAQLLNELQRYFFCRDVQRNDDFVFRHFERSREIARCYLWLATQDVSITLDMTICKSSPPQKSIFRLKSYADATMVFTKSKRLSRRLRCVTRLKSPGPRASGSNFAATI